MPLDRTVGNLATGAFTKLKARLRNAAERTLHDLRTAIGNVIDLVTPTERISCSTVAGCDTN